MVKVLFFAQLRDHAGVDAIELPLGDMRVVKDLLPVLSEKLPKSLSAALSDQSAMVSIDQHYAGWEAALKDGAEVGLLPPVSGG